MKATIVNAYIDEKVRTCYVTYSTGTEKLYPSYKLPKTVKTWLEDHEPDETGNALEPDEIGTTGQEDHAEGETVKVLEIVEPVEIDREGQADREGAEDVETVETDETDEAGREDHVKAETLDPEEPKILNVDMCQGYVCLDYSNGDFKTFGVSNVPENVLTWLEENKPDEFREWAKGYKILFMSNAEIISEIYQNRIKELKESETMETSPSPEGKPSEGLPENKTPYQTQNKARRAVLGVRAVNLSSEDIKRLYEALRETGKKLVKATREVMPKVLNMAGLILAAVALAVIDLVSWLLPILSDVGLSVACVAWGLIEDVFPYWMSETVKPNVINAGKEAIKVSAILAYMIRVALA